MANIDVTQIDGFENMTPEQKIEALLGVEIPEKVDTSKMVSKELFDRKASELAAANKKLQSKMTEDEQKQAEREAAEEAAKQETEALKAEIEELKKSKKIDTLMLGFSAIGFDDKKAPEMANIFHEQDSVKFFDNMKKFLADYKKAIEKELMDKTPAPGGNNGGKDDDDPAIRMAKKLFGDKSGTGKTYDDVLSHYTKK